MPAFSTDRRRCTGAHPPDSPRPRPAADSRREPAPAALSTARFMASKPTTWNRPAGSGRVMPGRTPTRPTAGTIRRSRRASACSRLPSRACYHPTTACYCSEMRAGGSSPSCFGQRQRLRGRTARLPLAAGGGGAEPGATWASGQAGHHERRCLSLRPRQESVAAARGSLGQPVAPVVPPAGAEPCSAAPPSGEAAGAACQRSPSRLRGQSMSPPPTGRGRAGGLPAAATTIETIGRSQVLGLAEFGAVGGTGCILKQRPPGRGLCPASKRLKRSPPCGPLRIGSTRNPSPPTTKHAKTDRRHPLFYCASVRTALSSRL